MPAVNYASARLHLVLMPVHGVEPNSSLRTRAYNMAERGRGGTETLWSEIQDCRCSAYAPVCIMHTMVPV